MVHGPNVMVGYHGLEKETEEVMEMVDGKRFFRFPIHPSIFQFINGVTGLEMWGG